MMVNESKEKATTTTATATASESNLSYKGVGLPSREQMLSLVGGESDYTFDEARDYNGVGLPAREEMLSLLVEAPKASDLREGELAKTAENESANEAAKLREKALLAQD